ncbi:D-inositol-3-phosphate glycosyltransferase [Micromonospora zamorensis]|uniref:D-inositol-3-phosphate glycosyltransferase n=1 Tax=Micromonospora zamorensis TaxID=709883 RepID=UPI00082018ED|nr:D-inositol-3-phosphate glycosyltransferase [Micromonospora zamorensis]WTE86097.1 D-inositol-3-phosphate glycosyltransferase [Micromonospora zamorensis]SCG65413.1 D-inositol-3-phosphate glycosyltransferase [Micromonospora zamorensis]
MAEMHTGVGRQRGAQPWPRPRRIATLSVHTSPLHQPGTGDAGGMNVYILEVARRLAEANVEVEIFTRATSGDLPPVVEMAPGVQVRHITSGPLEGLTKEELPGQLCAFTAGVLRAEASRPPGHYDLIHSHYWLSGQVGWLAKERWGVPLVHTAHTLAKVKNAQLAAGDRPEPKARVIGEEQVVAEADRLVANTRVEASDLLDRYDADPARVSVVQPGVDLGRFRPAPGERSAAAREARRRLGLPAEGYVVAFVGRIQPLKAPDVLIRAIAALRERDPALADQVTVVICGGPSGSGLDRPTALIELAGALGVTDGVRFLPPLTGDDLPALYRAADLVAVPSHNESFGLVALEAQACGTPVLAAAVGGLVTAVRDHVSGVLIDGHDPVDWARALGRLLPDRALRAVLARGAEQHARQFSWDRTVTGLLGVYGEAIAGHRARLAADLAGDPALSCSW